MGVVQSKVDLAIDTLEVSLKSVRVDNKRMTVAVFKQLKVSELVFDVDNPSSDKNDIPWGVVNYELKDPLCEKWVLASRGAELFKCSVHDYLFGEVEAFPGFGRRWADPASYSLAWEMAEHEFFLGGIDGKYFGRIGLPDDFVVDIKEGRHREDELRFSLSGAEAICLPERELKSFLDNRFPKYVDHVRKNMVRVRAGYLARKNFVDDLNHLFIAV